MKFVKIDVTCRVLGQAFKRSKKAVEVTDDIADILEKEELGKVVDPPKGAKPNEVSQQESPLDDDNSDQDDAGGSPAGTEND